MPIVTQVTRFSFVIASLWLCLFAVNSQAEQVSRFDNFEVHYNVFNSSFLSEDVAKAYQLVRSPNKHLLNISVRRLNGTQPDAGSVEQAAKVSGTLNDLMRKFPLEFREIREQGAIYYLAEIPLDFVQISIFDITVQPDGSAQSHSFQFKRTLYPDNR